MSLRTVAGEPMPPRPATEPEPTGWAVSTYSSTTARRMAARRSYTRSSIAGTRSYRVPRAPAALVRAPAGPRPGPAPPAGGPPGNVHGWWTWNQAAVRPLRPRHWHHGGADQGGTMTDAPGTPPPGWTGAPAPRNGMGTAALIL